MPGIPDRFPAYVAEREGDAVRCGVRELSPEDLPHGEVTIAVGWSSVNYKDALAVDPTGRVARISPLVPGVDLAGTVVASDAAEVAIGDRVIVHGYDLGIAHHGGYAGLARVPAAWVVPLPPALDERTAMAHGTAGFTAALSVAQLEEHGLSPGDGEVLVTGASGGVGSVAVGILAERGYAVVASTGKPDAAGWLRELGAASVIGRDEVGDGGRKPLQPERWAAAVDCVGGETLAQVCATLRYAGAVAASGLTGGAALETSVFPFILRGVALLGVDSVNTPMPLRRRIWERLATDLRPRPQPVTEIGLDGLDAALATIRRGGMQGRTLVRVTG